MGTPIPFWINKNLELNHFKKAWKTCVFQSLWLSCFPVGRTLNSERNEFPKENAYFCSRCRKCIHSGYRENLFPLSQSIRPTNLVIHPGSRKPSSSQRTGNKFCTPWLDDQAFEEKLGLILKAKAETATNHRDKWSRWKGWKRTVLLYYIQKVQDRLEGEGRSPWNESSWNDFIQTLVLSAPGKSATTQRDEEMASSKSRFQFSWFPQGGKLAWLEEKKAWIVNVMRKKREPEKERG